MDIMVRLVLVVGYNSMPSLSGTDSKIIIGKILKGEFISRNSRTAYNI